MSEMIIMNVSVKIFYIIMFGFTDFSGIPFIGSSKAQWAFFSIAEYFLNIGTAENKLMNKTNSDIPL
jgi:hypothetical protein